MQSDNKCADVITDSLLEGVDKHRTEPGVVRSIILHCNVCSFVEVLNIWMSFLTSPGADRHARPHGNCRSSHRGNRDHRGLAELDCSFPLAQTGGMTPPHCTTIYTPWSGSDCRLCSPVGSDKGLRGAVHGAGRTLPHIQ